MPANARPVERDATEELAGAFCASIRQHYLDRPRSSSTVLEILNALAAVTAFVVAGTKPDEAQTYEFFREAYEQQLATAPSLEGLMS